MKKNKGIICILFVAMSSVVLMSISGIQKEEEAQRIRHCFDVAFDSIQSRLFAVSGYKGMHVFNVSDGKLINYDTCVIHVVRFENGTPIIKQGFPSKIELNEEFDKFSKQLTEFESHLNSEITGDNLKWYVTGNSKTIFYITGDNSTGEDGDTIIFNSIINQNGIVNIFL